MDCYHQDRHVLPLSCPTRRSSELQAWNLPRAIIAEGKLLPSVSSVLANKPVARAESFRLDFFYNTDTIKLYSAADVIDGRVGRKELAGKDVIFAPTASAYQDNAFLPGHDMVPRSEEHTSELQSLMRISYAVFCLKKKNLNRQ